MGRRLCFILMFLVLAAELKADNPVNWSIDVSTTGQDVHWTSPTAITTGLAEYDWSYEITKVTATLVLLGDRDVTSLLGDSVSGSGAVPELPLVIIDETVDDDITGSSAKVSIEVDSGGFGQASITDIALGSILGFQITELRIEAMVDLVGYPFGDYDRDRDVDSADFNLWQETAGSSEDLRADGNRDAVVNAADYVVWRDNLGASAGSGSDGVAMVPEPSGTALLLVFIGVLLDRRRRRVG